MYGDGIKPAYAMYEIKKRCGVSFLSPDVCPCLLIYKTLISRLVCGSSRAVL